MGAGKSTALAAARAAGLETTEIDDLMEAAFGHADRARRSSEHGEDGLPRPRVGGRRRAAGGADGGAIALGGGSILLDRVRAALGRHVVVWLQVDAGGGWRRIAHTERPLAQERGGRRASCWPSGCRSTKSWPTRVVPMGDRGMIERALPAIRALAELPAGTKLHWAASASGEYPIYVGRDLLGPAFAADSPVYGALGGDGRWGPSAGAASASPTRRSARSTPSGCSRWRRPSRSRPARRRRRWPRPSGCCASWPAPAMTRGDHVVALGGGVVGDLAGFCAHVYQRGVPVVQVPTTLVSQVDSAYGGKTGVDLPEGKNYAGAYQLPALVVADTGTLETLPLAELAAGFVEVLKTGLLAGGALWERVRLIEELDPVELADVIVACAGFKCEVVAADERDGGLRHMLNLGHTVGHGIEAATAYERYRHGEAVGLGLLAALRLSEAPALRDEVEAILARHGLPTRIEGGDAALRGRSSRRCSATRSGPPPGSASSC